MKRGNNFQNLVDARKALHWRGKRIKQLLAALKAADARVAELESIVGELPQTRDGVVRLPGDTAWYIEEDGTINRWRVLWYVQYDAYLVSRGVHGVPVEVSECYAAHAAAEAAGGNDAG